MANIPDGPGEALDFGCGNSWLGLAAARKGFAVTAMDMRPITWPYDYTPLEFVRGDITTMKLPAHRYDLVICCSTIEHVGQSGRYGTGETMPDADLAAMKALSASAKADGVMLLTIPVGKDRIVRPWHRVYGAERLPRLLEGWNVLRSEYWIKNERNVWIMTEEATAMSVEPSDHYYGLGLYVLDLRGDSDRDARHPSPC